MEPISIKTVLAIAWVSVICVAGIAGNLHSLSGWAVLVVVAIVPPMILITWWKDPVPTLSESIQKARR